MEQILDLIDLYKSLLDRKEELADLEKQNNAAVEDCRNKLAEQMLEAEVTRVSRCGYVYSLNPKTKYSKKAGDDDAFFDLLRDHGLEGLIKQTVHAQTLQGAMSEVAKENDGELPPEFADYINIYEFTDVSKRKETSRK